MKLVAGKASIATLFATIVVSTFLLGKSFTSISAVSVNARAYCHANSADFYIYHNNPAWDAHLENNGSPLSGHELDFFTVVGDVDCDGQTDPTPTATVTATPTAEPTLDPCALLDIQDGCATATPTATPTQSATPEPTPVSTPGLTDAGPPHRNDEGQGGQVLGASTMASTGSFLENLYMAIMGAGATLFGKGLKKVKKTSKRA